MAPILDPDHQPIPSGVEALKDGLKNTAKAVSEADPRRKAAGLLLAATVYQEADGMRQLIAGELVEPDPVMQVMMQPKHADDPEREDYTAPTSFLMDRGAQSTSIMPFNNSEGWMVPRLRRWTVPPMVSTNVTMFLTSTSLS